ncbi:hypothetical protein [Xanthobacter aminoxidans]|uniref:hypothetical protein n=1 Tax=Xanthobacter aminoxidans TaxID=186280 RepID=UPI0037262BFC
MRRKGEFSRMHLERDYPFQVAIHPDLAREIHQLRFYPSIAPRTKTMLLRGEHRVVVCFGKEDEARAFMRHSQGELVRCG